MERKFSGVRLREHRLAIPMKAEQLALNIDRTVYTIHEYERDRALPGVNTVARLADSLGIAIDDLFIDVEEPSDAAA